MIRSSKRQLTRRSNQIELLEFLGAYLKNSVALERYLLQSKVSVNKRVGSRMILKLVAIK